MEYQELLKIKADLLCYGIRLTKEAESVMKLRNRYVLEKGFMHAAHFLIDDVVINTCVSERYCQSSPYVIRLHKNELILEKITDGSSYYISNIDVLQLPLWCEANVDGYNVGDYLRPHSLGCIACWPYLICDYYKNSEQCKFCSMGDYRIHACINPEIVGKMIELALKYNPQYEVALSGGTCNEPDRSLTYFSEVCNRAKAAGAEYISVETAPPEEMEFIDNLYQNGASAIIMNLEIADDELRKKICPGKARIPQQRYFDAFERAVKVFGRGNVSSVLIAGLQPADDILSMAQKMIELGVIPTIIPFKPLDGCLLRNAKIAEPKELLGIAKEIDKYLNINKLCASEQHGCTKCNGCSIEALYECI